MKEKYETMLSEILATLKSESGVDGEGNITTKGLFEWLLSDSKKERKKDNAC